jgi:competence protein ComFC
MTIELNGNWHKGLAFDVHSLSSTYLGPNEFGHDQWDTTRTEMGALVHNLKYRHDKSTLPAIVALLDTKIKGIDQFDYIIPIPPTTARRAFQPVTKIALALGQHYGVKVLPDFLAKRPGGPQLKNVDDPKRRTELLREALYIQADISIAGCAILLVDDLYRSGATLTVAAELLYGAGASKVSVLTMTKTRSKR